MAQSPAHGGQQTPAGPDPRDLSRRAGVILQEVDALPTLPDVAVRLLRLDADDEAEIEEIVRVIESDPALTARLLSVCRRGAFGLGDSVTTVERAVVLLGLDTLRSVVLSVYVLDWTGNIRPRESVATESGGPEEGGLDRQAFWRHSVSVAAAAELIAAEAQAQRPKADRVNPGEAFVAGLLHAVGVLALDVILPRAYARALDLWRMRGGSLASCERAVIGIDHHTVGKRLAERWGLPPLLRDAMWLYEQTPSVLEQGPGRSVVELLGIARSLCARLHLAMTTHGEEVTPDETRRRCEAASIDARVVERIGPRLHDAVSDRLEDLGLGEASADELLRESLMAADRQLFRLRRWSQRRLAATGSRSRLFDAIRRFERAVADELSAVEVMREIVKSASGVFQQDSGACVGAVFQPAKDEPWVVVGTERRGDSAVTVRLVEAPAAGAGDADDGSQGLERADLVALLGEPGRADGSPGATGRVRRVSASLWSWVHQRMAGEQTGTPRRIDPVLAGCADGPAAAAALVLFGENDDPCALTDEELEAMISAWRSALVSAWRHDRTRRLSELLAESSLELSQTQRQLTEIESMARLGELTAGAAHEMNNPLSVISGRSQALSRRLSSERDRASAREIVNAAGRLSDLIASLHTIACPPTPSFSGVSISDLVEDAVRDGRDRAEPHLARPAASRAGAMPTPVRVRVAEGVGALRADRALLQRALAEIVRNAFEAAPRSAVEILVFPDAESGRLFLQVRDDGRGMSAHAIAHAFDPFFSEKEAGRQTGLGLATAYRLIRLHDGRITIDSEPEKGTRVTVTLPDWKWEGGAGGDGWAGGGGAEGSAGLAA